MLKSIMILLSIAAHYDYEIWKMDVKTAFLNGSLDECIYMSQPVGFIKSGNEHMLCKLKKSIYGLKQASRACNTCFDTSIQCENESCVYKIWDRDKIIFWVLYVDDILLIGNNVSMLNSVKEWLSSRFDMKYLGQVAHILGIKLMRDRKYGISLSKDQSPKMTDEIEKMKAVPYASVVGSLMYAMLCTRPDIYFVVGMYLKRTRDYMLVYHSGDLAPIGYTDSDFQSDRDSRKSTSGYDFTLGGGAISWRSIKQSCVANSTMEAEYVDASEAAKEAVWLGNFLNELNRGDARVLKIASEDNLADPFTKSLPQKTFDKHVEGRAVTQDIHDQEEAGEEAEAEQAYSLLDPNEDRQHHQVVQHYTIDIYELNFYSRQFEHGYTPVLLAV
ncbi:retrovirus-related Pol polyprotein from transposon TNT 1-94 [Nicotiana tabacum]|uniref:Retrovirus-related Pol polyprotein from transposon TNT 1-94 n=1 Tax=Nicotiana tabacum TaxID=4097 RepID=A0AC58T4N7_TOBAC